MASVTLTPVLPADRPAVAAAPGHAAPALSLSRILVQALLIIALLLVNKAGLPGNVAFFAVIVLLVLRGGEWPLKAMTLMSAGLICNQWYVPKTPFWTVARFGIPPLILLLTLADMARLRVSLIRRGYYLAHLLFIAVSAVLSVLTGYMVHIALLKLFNYALGTTALFAQIAIQRARRRDLSEWFVTIIVVFVILGFASLPLGIAYNAKHVDDNIPKYYFNGPFYHSNTLGPFAAMMSLYLACVYLFGAYRNRWICGALTLSLLYFMRLSQSRTSFAALLAGLGIVLALTFILRRRRNILLRLNISRPAIIAAILGFVTLLVVVDVGTGGRLSREVTNFVNKSQELADVDIEQVLASRMSRIELSWANFQESPLIGIGFELSTEQWFRENATIFYAPVEKGFLPTAVLEQSGIIGAVFFFGTLVAMIGYLVKTMNVPGLVLFIGFLIVNCGEVMYFGFAGHGGFGWLLVGAGMLLGDFAVYDPRHAAVNMPWALRRFQPIATGGPST
jgi:hypothetical protein